MVLDKRVLILQRHEKTEHIFYSKLAKHQQGNNKKVLEQIAAVELEHHDTLQRISGAEVKPHGIRLFVYIALARLFGMTFAIKLLRRHEKKSCVTCNLLLDRYPKMKRSLHSDHGNEQKLIEALDEERVQYIRSMILGFNDALVELTGVLAGLTLILQQTKLIALSGFITGIAASLSMAASEYNSTRSEGGNSHPLKGAFYTGLAYIITVLVLVFPYFIVSDPLGALCFTIFNSVILIIIATFYLSIVKEVPFWKRLGEMLFISLGVTALTFMIGLLVQNF